MHFTHVVTPDIWTIIVNKTIVEVIPRIFTRQYNPVDSTPTTVTRAMTAVAIALRLFALPATECEDY